MRPCCCLTTRQGVIILGSILTLNFIVQIVMTVLHRDNLTNLFVTQAQFASIVANQALMLLMSVMLILAAVYKKRWALLPFIVFALINVFSLSILTIGAAVNLGTEFNGQVLSVLCGALFTFLLMVWALWTAIAYFLDLGRTEGYDGFGDKGRQDGSDLDSGYPPPRRHSKGDEERLHGIKPTVVSKMLRDFH